MQRDQYMTIDGHSGVKLQDANKVMDELLVRKQSRKTIYPEHVMDLDIRWFDQDRSHEKDGWYAKIDGTDMILDPNAVRTASKLIKSRSSYWQQFQTRMRSPPACVTFSTTRKFRNMLKVASAYGITANQ